MLEIKNISLTVDDKVLFKTEAINLNSGLYALVGRNGSGKSTFIKTILGQNFCNVGEILIKQKNIKEFQHAEIAKLVAVVYAKGSIFGNLTGKDVLMLGRIPHQTPFSILSNQDQKIIDDIIALMNLATIVDKEYQILSDGEKQLIMIGRALVQDTPIILLDEPAAFLDIVNHFELIKLLNKLVRETNKLIIYSTHQIQNIDEDCDGVLMISNNKLTLLNQKGNFKNSIEKNFGIA